MKYLKRLWFIFGMLPIISFFVTLRLVVDILEGEHDHEKWIPRI